MACGHPCDCPTYGAHLRAKNLQIGDLMNRDANRRWNRDCDLYRDARRQGIQPNTSTPEDTRKALDLSDKMGRAFTGGIA